MAELDAKDHLWKNAIELFQSKLAQAKIDAMDSQKRIKFYEELLKSASEKWETK